MRSRRFGIIGLVLAAGLFIGGCSGQPLSTREKGTGVGALLGAGSGAIVNWLRRWKAICCCTSKTICEQACHRRKPGGRHS